MTIAGIDLHKKFSYVTLMDQEGTISLRRKVPTNKEDIEAFFGSIEDSPRQAVLEPVSQWYVVYEMLERLGWDVHLAHPAKVKAIASARIKTDKIDSAVLGHLLRVNLLPEAYIPKREVRDWKELVRMRAYLVWLRSRAKNRTHSVLAKHAIQSPYADLFCKAGRVFLRSLKLRPPYQDEILRYLEIIELFDRQIKDTEREIESVVKDEPRAMLLTTIPGIAYFSALLIISEIGDIKRFPDWSHLASYAGLVPSTYSSGGVTRHGKITKLGSRWLRWILVEAAHKHGRRASPLGRMYVRLTKKKGRSTAKVAVARLLTRSIYHMLKKNEPWRENQKELSGDTLGKVIAREQVHEALVDK